MLAKLRSWLDINKIIAFLRKRILYVVGLLLVIAIIAGVGILYAKNPDFFKDLEGYGYIGIFFISIILNATIIIPISVMAIVSSMGAVMSSPLLVGIIAGVGAGIGEMTAYLAGRAGRGLLAKSSVYTRVEKWVKRWGWIAVFLLSVFPFVFDIAGIIAGAMRMPWWRFWLSCWAGRTVSYITVAYLGSVILKAIPWLN
ncbi:MAG: VTT domain-containing protein [Dehalococcoidales bacterium]|nr:VTT domain-containing protein [Dehalococcoidales bacterium]